MAGPIGLVVIMLAALLAITAFSYYSNRRDALALSDDVLTAIERRIAGELDAFLKPVEDTVRLTANFLENASFDIHNRDLLEPLGFRVLNNLSQVNNFIVADTLGNFLMIARQPDGTLHTKIIERTAGSAKTTWIRRDKAGNVIDEETSPDDSYDPRNRTWFKGAVNSQEIFWTDFYIFFSSQTHGVTVSQPIMGQNDNLLGVFGLDIEVKEISAFLETLKIGMSGEAIIIDEEGYIVAHPEIEKMVKREGEVFKPIQVEELGNPVLNRAYNRFRIEGHGHRDFVVDGRRYLSAAFLMPHKTGLDLSVFVFVPEEDFVGFVARNNRTILLMSSGIVILAAIMAALLMFQALRAERSAQQVLERQHELEAQSRAFSDLSSKAALFGDEDTDSYKQLTEIVTDAINLRRTSLWQFDDDGRVLKCVDSYDRESSGHTYGTVLERSEFASLFDVLQNGQDISSEDAETDSTLTELFQVYLQPLGCRSLLAVPIRFHDWMAGTLWFEHERKRQGWTGEEISFAHAIANMLALRFSADRKSSPVRAGQIDETAGDGDSVNSKPARAITTGDMGLEPNLDKTDHIAESAKPASKDATTRLPSFADRLAAGGIAANQSPADIYTDTTVLALRFTDPISLAGRIADEEPKTVVDMMVAYLEEAVASLGIEYMKMMGEEIICVAGIDSGSKDHARRIADLALDLQNHCTGIFTSLNTTMKFQIGIDTGAVMGSEVGREQKIYNIWGEAVRFASKMAESGIAGGIQVSQTTYQRLRANYLFQVRSRYYLPNIGETSTYLLTGRI
ncbi:MAG: GAF domain-containing protein [Deltaproteobacteria bacterium]|jgi:class 3 adenylate cyclase|nr:GAF domain-containing protein [Deltaproteobacteria bacterium]